MRFKLKDNQFYHGDSLMTANEVVDVLNNYREASKSLRKSLKETYDLEILRTHALLKNKSPSEQAYQEGVKTGVYRALAVMAFKFMDVEYYE